MPRDAHRCFCFPLALRRRVLPARGAACGRKRAVGSGRREGPRGHRSAGHAHRARIRRRVPAARAACRPAHVTRKYLHRGGNILRGTQMRPAAARAEGRARPPCKCLLGDAFLGLKRLGVKEARSRALKDAVMASPRAKPSAAGGVAAETGDSAATAGPSLTPIRGYWQACRHRRLPTMTRHVTVSVKVLSRITEARTAPGQRGWQDASGRGKMPDCSLALGCCYGPFTAWDGTPDCKDLGIAGVGFPPKQRAGQLYGGEGCTKHLHGSIGCSCEGRPISPGKLLLGDDCLDHARWTSRKQGSRRTP